jgi:hypothetical protein
MNIPWTVEEDRRLQKAYESGIGEYEVAETMEPRTLAACKARRKILALDGGISWTNDQDTVLLKSRPDQSWDQIGAALGAARDVCERRYMYL